MRESVIFGDESISFMRHMMQVFGLRPAVANLRVEILVQPTQLDAEINSRALQGNVVMAILPSHAFCQALGVDVVSTPAFGDADLDCTVPLLCAAKLRTLHPSLRFHGQGEPVIVDHDSRTAWLFVPKGAGGVLLVGTSVIADIIRYRQGDPLAERPREAVWDIAGERPIYLFEKQILGLPRYQERQADFWAVICAGFLSAKLRIPLLAVLPGGVDGAVVLTGDDDQAQLEKYGEQLKLIGSTPITYFLHPLTRHTSDTLNRMLRRYQVDLGIHPDALEEPQNYTNLLHQQCAWFEGLTTRRANSVRNHGFLNDGYWGHLKPWIDEKIHISSNIPGLDGRALNGSLLPARVYAGGSLTNHWSVVTAIGDGVRYVNGGKSDVESANCIFDLADAIRQSGIPGVMVLNFHPQNVSDTRAMHLAALEVIRSGFIGWNMRDCLDWFADGLTRPRGGFFQRTFERMLPRGLYTARRTSGSTFKNRVS